MTGELSGFSRKRDKRGHFIGGTAQAQMLVALKEVIGNDGHCLGDLLTIQEMESIIEAVWNIAIEHANNNLGVYEWIKKLDRESPLCRCSRDLDRDNANHG